MMCDLTVRLSSPKAGNFGLMRAVVHNQLGQGLLRSMSAVAKAESQWDSGIHLTVADVDIMEDHYAVAWGLKRQKQDRFNDCVGEDGRDWCYTSGHLGNVLDIVP